MNRFLRKYVFKKIILQSIFLGLVLTACNNNTSQNTLTSQNSIVQTDSAKSPIAAKYDYVISNVPIPFEVLDKLYKSGVIYNSSYPNLIENINKYNESNGKAMNLGIYGADLTYAISFEQFNAISPYLKNCKNLADQLGIPLAFNSETLQKYSDFNNNKDTLTHMVYKSYNEVDKTLKSNQRIGLAALVVAGGWIESAYLTTQTAINTTDNPAVLKSLSAIMKKQQFNLNNIIGLLNEFKTDDYFADLVTELQQIQAIYNSLNDKKDWDNTEVKLLSQQIIPLRNKLAHG